MNDVRELSMPERELSCFLGNLFAALEPPCLVETNSISLASAQARKLTHSVVSPLPVEPDGSTGAPFGPPGALTLTGRTAAGREATLFIYRDYCLFVGDPDDLEAVRNGKCPCKQGCDYGR